MCKWIASAALGAIMLSPGLALAGVFIGVAQDLVDPSKGEQPQITITFDENLFRAHITIDGGGVHEEYSIKPVKAGQDHHYTWKQGPGEVRYDVSVLMVSNDGSKDSIEDVFFVVSAGPITASIPASSVDLESKSFDLVTNHPPSLVKLKVLSDQLEEIGSSDFIVRDAVAGEPTRVSWEQQKPGNIFRIVATVYDDYDYYSEVEIIPWSLSIPHEDVIFPTGSHELLAEESPKVDAAWSRIVAAIEKYGEWVRCTLYVGGYTDTVGDGASNQALSQRRAKTLAEYFRSKGAKFPIFYQGFGEGAQAVSTGDNVEQAANRRALYLVTGGAPPTGRDTPRASWSRLR